MANAQTPLAFENENAGDSDEEGGTKVKDITILGDELGTEIVTLHVGKTLKVFAIHKELIAKVPFFSSAFNGCFLESCGVMRMPEDSSEAFSVFVHWLYKGELPNYDGKRKFVVKMLHLYIFAEKICCNELANITMDLLQRLFGPADSNKSTIALLAFVYHNTCDGSPLRDFFIDDLVHNLIICGSKPLIPQKKDLEKLFKFGADSSTMLIDFFSYARDTAGVSCDVFWTKDVCAFHRHAKDETCNHSLKKPIFLDMLQVNHEGEGMSWDNIEDFILD